MSVCLCVLPVQTRYTNGSSSACIDRMPTLQRWESWEATCSSEKTLLSPILHSTHLSNFRKPSWFMIGCTAQYVWDCRRPSWEYYGNHIQQTLCCEIPWNSPARLPGCFNPRFPRSNPRPSLMFPASKVRPASPGAHSEDFTGIELLQQ